jgi:hypothetical protein|tara:strand:+ start:55 stop:285 length:231 start_codon:yes stop_codon:yes gene_type:complete
MSLKDKLINGQSNLTSLNGETPSTPNRQQSTLHKEYSTIDDPIASRVAPTNGVLPQPSSLNRVVIPSDKYLNNLPG